MPPQSLEGTVTTDHDAHQRGQSAERYALAEMTPAEREAFEAHLFWCAECTRDVEAAQGFLDAARVALRTESAPAGSRLARMFRWRLALPARTWPVAARLSMVVSLAALVPLTWQALVVAPGLRRELADRERPRALVAQVVPPAARGAGDARLVRVSRAAGMLLLAVEPNLPGAGGYLLELRGPDGNAIGAAIAAEPPAVRGDRLQIMVPLARLGAGDYVLLVRDREGRGAPLPHPFRLQPESDP
jgi:hypothetical protein